MNQWTNYRIKGGASNLGVFDATVGSDLLTHTPDLASGEFGEAGIRGVVHEVGYRWISISLAISWTEETYCMGRLPEGWRSCRWVRKSRTEQLAEGCQKRSLQGLHSCFPVDGSRSAIDRTSVEQGHSRRKCGKDPTSGPPRVRE